MGKFARHFRLRKPFRTGNLLNFVIGGSPSKLLSFYVGIVSDTSGTTALLSCFDGNAKKENENREKEQVGKIKFSPVGFHLACLINDKWWKLKIVDVRSFHNNKNYWYWNNINFVLIIDIMGSYSFQKLWTKSFYKMKLLLLEER